MAEFLKTRQFIPVIIFPSKVCIFKKLINNIKAKAPSLKYEDRSQESNKLVQSPNICPL